ncbi:MAG TPA: sodium-dependent transporter [Acidobacteriota bacterium]|nr:sodium-dependent transporter [Acidobacteriota bacterium]
MTAPQTESGTRDTFGSTLGTVLTTAGVAIGLGNIWRFPYMMGAFGGAWFLIVYLAVVVGLGVPALMSEWALGRCLRRGPMGAFERASFPVGKAWGWLLLITVVMASSYYAVVLGWVLCYAVFFATGQATAPADQMFDSLAGSLPTQFAGVWVCLALSCAALAWGVKSGIQRVSSWFTPLFFALFLGLIVYVLSLPQAWTRFWSYLLESTGDFSAQTVLAALGQGLFSLSLGGTYMLVYGSYLRDREDIPRGALMTASLDVSAAMLACLLVIPSVLVFGIDLASGPSLMFVTMPQVFQSMTGGALAGTLFFLSVLLVALLSLIGAYEVIVAALGDAWGWPRPKALIFILLTQTVLIVPPMLSRDYIFYSDLIWGSTMQPVGAALSVMALAWSLGRAKALEEISRQSRLPVPGFLVTWLRWVVPGAIVLGLIYGWTG